MNFHGKWNLTNTVFLRLRWSHNSNLVSGQRFKVRKIKWSSSNHNLLSNKITICKKSRKWLWNGTDVSNSSCGPDGYFETGESDPIWKWHCRFYYSMSHERSFGVRIVEIWDLISYETTFDRPLSNKTPYKLSIFLSTKIFGIIYTFLKGLFPHYQESQ